MMGEMSGERTGSEKEEEEEDDEGCICDRKRIKCVQHGEVRLDLVLGLTESGRGGVEECHVRCQPVTWRYMRYMRYIAAMIVRCLPEHWMHLLQSCHVRASTVTTIKKLAHGLITWA